jgi:cell division protein FtsW (lipid II flippase)
LLLGLYQYFFGAVGYKLIIAAGGMKEVMKDAATRFWAVEHITSMILAIVLITIGHIRLKKGAKASTTATFYLIALLLILSAIPWPFRADIGRPWLPGL